MIKPIGGYFYRTLAERQIAAVAQRNHTSFDIGKIILENNKRLCNEINAFNKVADPHNNFVYALNSTGEFIKTLKSVGKEITQRVADNEIIKLIEKMRAVVKN